MQHLRWGWFSCSSLVTNCVNKPGITCLTWPRHLPWHSTETQPRYERLQPLHSQQNSMRIECISPETTARCVYHIRGSWLCDNVSFWVLFSYERFGISPNSITVTHLLLLRSAKTSKRHTFLQMLSKQSLVSNRVPHRDTESSPLEGQGHERSWDLRVSRRWTHDGLSRQPKRSSCSLCESCSKSLKRPPLLLPLTRG